MYDVRHRALVLGFGFRSGLGFDPRFGLGFSLVDGERVRVENEE